MVILRYVFMRLKWILFFIKKLFCIKFLVMGKEYFYYVFKSFILIFLWKYDDDIIYRKNEWNIYYNVKFFFYRIFSLVYYSFINIIC